MSPLAAVLADMTPEENIFGLRVGLPEDIAGWGLCTDVTPQRRRRRHGPHGRDDESGHTVGWYAGIAGYVGGTFFRRARRVPRLGVAVLAFRFAREAPYPDAIALLDERFWCLPTDPSAGHPAATPVPDEAALGVVLRRQVAAFREETLAVVRPAGARPRPILPC